MDFLITQETNGPGNVNIRIVANYTNEEAAALSEARAWGCRCMMTYTFDDLVTPGVLIANQIPVYADHFQSRFPSTCQWEAQQQLAPILESFRKIIHTELTDQKNAYFGRPLLPPYRKLLPRS